jgi:hypothetical protein
MNKITYAAFSVFIALLLSFIMVLNFTTKFIAGLAIMGFLFATMIRMIVVVAFRKARGNASLPKYNVFEMNGDKVKYA